MKRIYHTWDKWECYPSGFYDERPPKRPETKREQIESEYAEFLADIPKFKSAMAGLIRDWKSSCEHYLSNENMNRIAWLGQAAACYALGIPSAFRSGYHKLSEQQQKDADAAALEYLNIWLKVKGEPELTPELAQSKTEANLY